MEKITFEEVQQALVFAARDIGAILGTANLPADDRDRLKRRQMAFEAAHQMLNELATERLMPKSLDPRS